MVTKQTKFFQALRRQRNSDRQSSDVVYRDDDDDDDILCLVRVEASRTDINSRLPDIQHDMSGYQHAELFC